MKKVNPKKILAGLSSACMIASAATVASPLSNASAASATLYGDADLSGVISVSDIVTVLQYTVNKNKYPLESDIAFLNADVDLDGDVTVKDAALIQQADAGLITLPVGEVVPGTTEPSTTETTTGEENPVAEITYIHLNGASATIDGNYAEVNGSVITITHSGTFYVDGTLDDGQINVNVADEVADPETVKIFLNGVSITGKSAPAILITNAENTSINLVDGTTNTISDGDTAYSGDNLGAAVIEAKDDITIKGGTNGTGILNLTANTQDGIACNNDLKITGGVVNVNTLNATDETDAIKGKTSVTVKGGEVNVDAEGDGIKSSEGTVAIEAGDVEIKAGNDAIQSAATIDISGGSVLAGGDRGLTATTGVNITGGTVIVTATDSQIDASLLTSGQGTILLNCIDDATSTDGTWKKANAITVGNVTASKWVKKYKYVLISDASLTRGQSYTLTNASTGATVTYNNDANDSFTLTNSITTFDNVNPAGKTEGGEVVTPVTTDGMTLTLSGNSITSDAPADSVTVASNVATITKPGVYTVTGSGSGSQIIVDVDKTAYPDGVVELDLNGVTMSNESVAPIYVASIGDEVQIVAKNGTVNTISDGASHTDSYTDSDGTTNEINAAIFSRDDLKIKGKGTLIVNGNYQDGIVSKNDLKLYNGNIQVNAVDDGIRGKDSVTIGDTTKSDGSAADNSGLSVTVKTTAGDGIKSSATDASTSDKEYGVVTINGGTINVNSFGDGIQAEQNFVMNDGDLTIYTYQGSSYTASGSSSSYAPGGGPGSSGGMGMDGNSNKMPTDMSAKGIKSVGLYDAAGTTWQSAGNITINGGSVNIDASDDAIHCGGDMNLVGGAIELASADDGAHSDHTLTIGTKNSGKYDDVVVAVSKSYEGIEGQKIYHNSGSVVVNSTDDGYNAAGGSDGSGTSSGNPWSQGGFGGSASGDYVIEFNGGFALVNVADGDHDGYDSNGNIVINGGYIVTNGNEPFDCGDSGNTISVNGGTWVSNCGSGGMSMGGSTMNASVTASASVSADTRLSLVGSDGKVIVSFIVDKNVSQLKAGGSGVSGSFYTGGTLSGSTYFQELDQTQLAGFGGTLSGGTAAGSSNPWG